MKLTKMAFCFATLVLGIASAASSYTINLSSEASAGSKTLKPGTYKLQVEGNQAVFKQGKESISIPVTVEKSANKFAYTSVDTMGSTLREIDLGGTNTKVVFGTARPTSTSTE
ncbi:MAG TPA: hypothetical protein VKT49_04370 [Bryobacteraceae bacterium]|nr:hypothetical protein [Bryobacteraceae bacterium]